MDTRRVLGVLAISASFGCGVSKVVAGSGGAGGSGPGGAGSAGGAGERGGGAIGGMGGATSDVGASCRFASAAEAPHVVLAVSVDGGVVLVMSDGSSTAPVRFASARPANGISFFIRFERRGAEILATGTWWGMLDGGTCELANGVLTCPEIDRMVRFGLDGRVLGDQTFSGRAPSSSLGIAPRAPPAEIEAGADAAVPPDPAGSDAGEAVWVFPDGLSPLGRMIDQQGWFVAVLRNDTTAGVYRSPDGASDWRLLGKTLGQVEEVGVRNVAGTYAIDARGVNSFFVPKQVWQPAPAGQEPELSQSSHQLVRPSSGVGVVIDPDSDISVALTDDGACAAVWQRSPTGRVLVIYDLEGGSQALLVQEAVGISLPGTLWIE